MENFIPLMNGASPGLVVKQNGEIGQTSEKLWIHLDKRELRNFVPTIYFVTL